MKAKRNNAVGPQVRAKPRRRGRLFPALVGASFLAAAQAATQTFASATNYDVSLGGHFHHVYAPWTIFQWGTRWGWDNEAMSMAAGAGVLVGAASLIGISLAQLIRRNTSRAAEYLHGSARWADRRDIEAAGLLPRSAGEPDGPAVYVGGWQDRQGRLHYLRHSGPEHVLTYAPTRSGKGVGLVIPTLLSWPASAVVTDLKGELWALTAGWRREHARNKVLRFEPASSHGGVRWNPLDEIRVGTEYEIGDVQNLAVLIVDPDGRGLADHWQKTAYALLVGVIVHVLYKRIVEGTPATISEVDRLLSDPSRSIDELWMEMATYKHVDGKPHDAAALAAGDMQKRHEEEATSVLSTAKSFLALYRDPVVARNVATSEFRVADLMNHADPVSLYIVTQPNDKSRLRPLVRLLLSFIVRLLADRMTFEQGRAVAHYRHRLLMMLDEFPSLGKLEILQESLAFVAGYGIKCYLICQDINQLKSRELGYGQDEAITSNCHVQNAFPPNRVETAEHLSRLTGQTTVVKEQITTSGRRSSALLGQVSRTMQEVQRPLLTPDECLRMPGPKKNGAGDIIEAGDMVIYAAGYPAIYGKQVLYFKDPVFLARASIPAPAESDRLVAGRGAAPSTVTI